MKAHVISLKKDIERREKVSKLLRKFGYEFEIYDAVVPETSDAFGHKLQINTASDSVGPGEVACALSHSDNLNNDSFEYIFILEDDVIPLKENPFNKTFPHDLTDGEVLLLALTIKHEWVAYNLKTKRLGVDCLRLDRLSISMLRGGCAYIVNRNTAKSMVDVQRQNLVVADAWKAFYNQKAINYFYYSEYFLHPNDFTDSNLEAERSVLFPKVTLNRKLLKFAASIFFRIARLFSGSHYISLPSRNIK